MRVIPEQYANYHTPKTEWTEWHSNLRKLLMIIQGVVEEDHEKRRSARRSGNASNAELNS